MIHSAVITFAFIFGLAAQSWAAEPLRVMAWNIHHGEGIDGKLDLVRIAEVIKAAKPDLVALQEVDQNCNRSGKIDQTAVLGKLTGLYAVFGKAIDYDGGAYGQAILSRLPTRETRVHRLPGAGEPRIAFEVQVEVEGNALRFVTVHLEHQDRERNAAQGARLAEIFAGEEMPVILAGDFNAQPDSPTLRLFESDWTFVAKDGPVFTSPADEPRREIDHILIRGALGRVNCHVLTESIASDHRPVFAELKLVR